MGRLRPQVVVLDVNETLSDLEPLRAAFQTVGLPGHQLETWFSSTLRDGFALTAAGTCPAFADVASDVLRQLLHTSAGATTGAEDAVGQVLGSFMELDVHPDVRPGLELLHDAGIRLVTLTNGSTRVAKGLFERAGMIDLVEQFMSVEEAGRWKPAPEAYRFAANECGVEPERMALVAVHPWDIDGAVRVGMTGGWVNRRRRPYPEVMLPPHEDGDDLVDLARSLLTLPSAE